jgi:hypothetical protein
MNARFMYNCFVAAGIETDEMRYSDAPVTVTYCLHLFHTSGPNDWHCSRAFREISIASDAATQRRGSVYRLQRGQRALQSQCNQRGGSSIESSVTSWEQLIVTPCSVERVYWLPHWICCADTPGWGVKEGNTCNFAEASGLLLLSGRTGIPPLVRKIDGYCYCAIVCCIVWLGTSPALPRLQAAQLTQTSRYRESGCGS